MKKRRLFNSVAREVEKERERRRRLRERAHLDDRLDLGEPTVGCEKPRHPKQPWEPR